MKFVYKLSAFFLLIFALASCRSYKDLIYFQDAGQDTIIPTLPVHDVEYVIRPGDILYVSVKSINEDVNRVFDPEERAGEQSGSMGGIYTSPEGAYLYGYDVDTAGILNLPIMGRIPVAGLTQAQAEETVQKKADEFVKDALVKVKVLNYKVTILGEVGSPGIYYYYGQNFTILDALALAGGEADYASINKVMVIRSTKHGNKTFMLDLKSKRSYLSEAFYIQPNDYVFVQPDQFKTIQLSMPAISLAFSTISFMIAMVALILSF